MIGLTLIEVFIAVLLLGLIFYFTRQHSLNQRQSEAIKNLEKSFTEMLGVIKEIKGSFTNTSEAMHRQIFSFAKETTEMKKHLEEMRESVRSISSFQEIFRTPKLRGEWGEASLDHILSEYFPREFYLKNYQFSSGTQVEFALKLPNEKILAIDAKFFSDNFEKLKTAKTDEEVNIFRKKLIQDIKFNVQDISSKYIVPSENTVDFALMFIPAEAIFYEIMFNLRDEDIAGFARSKKVILTSPNTIYLTLRTIVDWFKDTQVSRRTKEILKRLNKIQLDAQKLTEDFRKLGTHLKNASLAYDSSEKRLFLFSNKVEKLFEEEKSKKFIED